MTLKIPIVDLDALHRPLREDILEAFTRCLDHHSFILGEEVRRFEEAIAAYCEVPFALGVSSGTDALLVSLMAEEIGPGDEVLVPAFSFFATASAVSRLGATPVFVDIDEETFNLDPAGLEPKLTARTKAIVPVHLYGQCAEMGSVLEIAERASVVVIEDAAQSLGARYRDGRRTGSLGSIGAFSFYPSKNLGAVGDAGMVTTSDEARAELLRKLRTHGGSQEYFHERVGGNFRIDAIQAAILHVKLAHLDEWTAKRRERARIYDGLFEESGLTGKGYVRTPRAALDHVYHQYVIRARRRDQLREHLTREGIGTAIYYPVPLHLQPCFRGLGYEEGDLPEAEKAASETLALPMHPYLTGEQQKAVVSSVARFYGG